MREDLHAVMAAHVARGEVPSVITLVARGDDVEVDAIGAPRDTIFRISSMTKPIAAAAALVLVERGQLGLDEPVERWLPELANRRVLRRIDGPLDDTVPAHRAITVRDVLTFTFGFGMVWGPQDAYPIQRAANALHLGAFGPPHPQEPPAPDEWMKRFGTLPLMDQPGERWRYQTGSEVLGVLIARASGRPFDAFLREAVFEPLGMRDTAFHVPADTLDRFTPSYLTGPSGKLELFDELHGEWSRPPAFPSGGAGLVSTIDDYHAFARMLLAGGGRVLSRESVAMMTSDQLAPAQKQDGSLLPGFFATRGWGFGVAVAGSYGWDGGFGTSWRNDPHAGTIAILMMNGGGYPELFPPYRSFWAHIGSAQQRKPVE